MLASLVRRRDESILVQYSAKVSSLCWDTGELPQSQREARGPRSSKKREVMDC